METVLTLASIALDWRSFWRNLPNSSNKRARTSSLVMEALNFKLPICGWIVLLDLLLLLLLFALLLLLKPIAVGITQLEATRRRRPHLMMTTAGLLDFDAVARATEFPRQICILFIPSFIPCGSICSTKLHWYINVLADAVSKLPFPFDKETNLQSWNTTNCSKVASLIKNKRSDPYASTTFRMKCDPKLGLTRSLCSRDGGYEVIYYFWLFLCFIIFVVVSDDWRPLVFWRWSVQSSLRFS